MSDERLKPCPFCGGEATVVGHNIFFVKCTNCEIETLLYRHKDRAVEYWNTRKPMERIVEMLEDKFVSTWDCGYEGGYKDAIVDAIEIVKGGGVDD